MGAGVTVAGDAVTTMTGGEREVGAGLSRFRR
jgi:hypothetical protein